MHWTVFESRVRGGGGNRRAWLVGATVGLLGLIGAVRQVGAQTCSAVFLTDVSSSTPAQPNGAYQTFSGNCTGVPNCGHYFDIYLAAGMTLNLSTCPSEGGSRTWDNSFSIFSGSAPTLNACNDDFCGLGSFLSYTAPTSRVYRAKHGSYAGGLGGSYTWAYRAPVGAKICRGPGITDSDGDGVDNICDNCPTPNPAQSDCDDDGIGDACDTDPDGDGDGVADTCDNCVADANPTQTDGDLDGFGDACDSCVGPGPTDVDADGICVNVDNCPVDANPSQQDSDFNGIGDACNDANDADGDEFEDPNDNCPVDANPGQEDSDFDGYGDVCDPCVGVGTTDGDGDGICDAADNCVAIVNPGQEDDNGDGTGDACSPVVTISGITQNGGANLEVDAAVSSPADLPLSGSIVIGDCLSSSVTALTFTWLATSCDAQDTFELTINGTVVAAPVPDPSGLTCSCIPPTVGTYSVPIGTVLPLLIPGVNEVGIRKTGAPHNTAFAWAYATVTISGTPIQVNIFDAFGGGSYGNPDVCGSGFTFGAVDSEAPMPPTGMVHINQPWTGDLPCSLDISSLAPSGCYALAITAEDGVVGVPSLDASNFALTTETTLVRADGNACDDGLYCNGVDTCSAGTCVHAGDPCAAGLECNTVCDEPTDLCFDPNGTPCSSDGNPCTVDGCDGAGMCDHDAGNPGAICRIAANVCDVAETCDGASATCPPNGFAPNSTSCDDDSVCTQTDQCNGSGICVGSNPLDCSDGNICTADTCDAIDGCANPGALATGCKAAQTSILILKQNGGAGDKQLFKWVKGDALTQTELDDPTGTTEYGVCIFSGPTNELLESFAVPAAGGNWSAIGDKGYKYKELTGTNGGITKVLLKGGDAGKTKALVKGKGDALPDPTLTNLPLPVTAQVINPDTGGCVEAVFDTGDVKKNTDTLFKAKAQ